jgi:hypothetical protein
VLAATGRVGFVSVVSHLSGSAVFGCEEDECSERDSGVSSSVSAADNGRSLDVSFRLGDTEIE